MTTRRYAITFSLDDDWNTVDTAIMESDLNPLNMTTEQLRGMFGQLLTSEDAEKVANDGDRWFVRNLDDTDFKYILNN